MKYIFAILICLSNTSFAQQWQAEVMVGASGYSGDLTRHNISLKTMGPSVAANLKYLMPNKYVAIRIGLAYGRVSGSDKNNKEPVLNSRNLNFKTHILEGSVGAELNLLDPEYFTAYPYVFAALGLFHFDPYTFDKENRKTFLRSLGTEGQGLEEYPNKTMYSLTQFCIPIGAGWKWNFGEKYQIIYEIGARYLLTDYLDDVSTTYANPQALQADRGRIAAELAYRGPATSFPIEGVKRGNSKRNDWYYITGIKLLINLD